MRSTITAFIPYAGYEHSKKTVNDLRKCKLVQEIFLLTVGGSENSIEGCKKLNVENLVGSDTINLIKDNSNSTFTLMVTQDNIIEFGQFGIERFAKVAEGTGSGLLYSDYYDNKDDTRIPHPAIDYQIGSLRDDFNFGYVYFMNTHALKEALAEQEKKDYKFAGLYDLRLKISQNNPVIRIPEYLYTTSESDTRKSGEKIFDYVDPRNRAVQVEMEIACTYHLKRIGAYLEPKFEKVNLDEEKFELEASVIIPVKNRIKTVADAVNSVLMQKTTFNFNLIVVDNYSTDGTTEILKSFAEKDKRVVHVIPERKDLGIGGCWNEAAHHPKCGKIAIQLDSDDVYKDETTIQKVVDKFKEDKCAMVVGTYQMTNFKLEEIPPGIIDHKEWTPDNGRNNALRINGLGAPRAFYTPILREIKIPNVSYGEDYALGLAISRNYQIGRIYEPVYLCRRWEENSDASLDIVKMNGYNLYKDRIRSLEVLARQRKNAL
ncbi:MAG: glycosyltransferase family 2 protein [Ignavibacteriales bacterium]|nr:glycosyltransferase family 2 protein [Ignavibacteriales bacterium]